MTTPTFWTGRAIYLRRPGSRPSGTNTEIGYNYRMSNTLAALGFGQLERLDRMVSRRREIRARYVAGLGDVDGVDFLVATGHRVTAGVDVDDNHWLTSITLDPALIATDPSTLMTALDAADIKRATSGSPCTCSRSTPVVARHSLV